MSGPKCGQAELNRQRREALRLLREREERVRRARETQQHDTTRMKAVQQSVQRVTNLLQHAQDLLDSHRAEGVGQYTSVELATWEPMCEAIRRDIDGTLANLTRAQQRFEAATQAWQTNTEAYQGGYFDALDYSSLTRQAEAALVEARRIIRIASARHDEQRLRQELGRSQAEAQAALTQAQAHRDQLEALPYAALGPAAAGELDKQMAQVEQLIAHGDFETATSTALQIRERCQTLSHELQDALTAWQAAFDQAVQAIEAIREQATALDQAFVRKWVPGSLDGPLSDLETLEQALATAQTSSLDHGALEGLVAQAAVVGQALQAAREQADERSADEMVRREIVQSLDKVLRTLSFNVGVRLDDRDNPCSDVLLNATHPGGQEMAFQVDWDHQIKMNLEDGVKGADCVADVYQLIDGLRATGVELAMTHWGSVDPERVRHSTHAPARARRQQTHQ